MRLIFIWLFGQQLATIAADRVLLLLEESRITDPSSYRCASDLPLAFLLILCIRKKAIWYFRACLRSEVPLQDVSASEPSAQWMISSAVPLRGFPQTFCRIRCLRRCGCWLQQGFVKENTKLPKCQGMSLQIIFHANARIRESNELDHSKCTWFPCTNYVVAL